MSKRTHTRRDHKLRTEFFDEGKRLDADPETRHLSVCHLCKQRIDYNVAPHTTQDSHNLDHYFPVEDYPDLQDDPDNFRHAHMSCNASRGKRGIERTDLGEAVPDWW